MVIEFYYLRSRQKVKPASTPDKPRAAKKGRDDSPPVLGSCASPEPRAAGRPSEGPPPPPPDATAATVAPLCGRGQDATRRPNERGARRGSLDYRLLALHNLIRVYLDRTALEVYVGAVVKALKEVEPIAKEQTVAVFGVVLADAQLVRHGAGVDHLLDPHAQVYIIASAGDVHRRGGPLTLDAVDPEVQSPEYQRLALEPAMAFEDEV